MTVKDIKEILNAEILCGEDKMDMVVHSACGSDMMSEVLAFSHDHSVLLTGLCNQQSIRTAEMMDIEVIVYIRGKVPTEDVIELAKESGKVVMTTKHRMYASCGLLYVAGLPSASSEEG